MSLNKKEFRSITDKLVVVGYNDKECCFLVKSPFGNIVQIADTYSEMFSMWVGRILITADDKHWALTAASSATGFATSVIMSPAEAGIEGAVAPDNTPDNREGVLIQIYNRDRFQLKNQMILRIGQCIMTCPTTSVYDALPTAKRKIKVGRSLRLFGDGFQRKGMIGERKVWRIPVMEGDFIVEDTFGAGKAIAGGTLLIFTRTKSSGLSAAEKAVKAIRSEKNEVILPFPGGICRSGSKVGSLKYKLKASTNHPFCPGLRMVVPDSQLPNPVNCVYEIVVNGLTIHAIKTALTKGIRAAVTVPGVFRISAGNYGGKLGQYKAYLRETIGEA